MRDSLERYVSCRRPMSLRPRPYRAPPEDLLAVEASLFDRWITGVGPLRQTH